jgi:type IV pilus assembly protein PilM
MPTLCLDIGTFTFKAIAGKPGSSPTLTKVIESPNPLGVSVPTDDAQAEKLAGAIDAFLSDHNLPRAELRLSLPETVVSTKVISLPWLSDAELASAIGWQAEQHIPIPPEELSLEYQVLFRPQKGDRTAQMRVLLVGVRKQVVERYIATLAAVGAEPVILESHMLSVIRSLQFSVEDPATLVVHLGASTMDVAVVEKGEVVFVVTHAAGGQILTKTLEQNVGLSGEQAEQYKRSYGLDETQFQGKMREALMSPVKSLIQEMQKAVRFHGSQHPTSPIQRALLSGGSAQLPGLVPLVAQELNMETLIAAPFAGAKGEVPTINSPSFAVAMGLMLRAD